MQLKAIAPWAALVVAVILGIHSLGLSLQRLRPEWLYQRDFIQEYLIGQAVLDGANPYQDLRILSETYLARSYDHLPTPSTHAPLMAVLASSLALLPFGVASKLWFGLELTFVFFSLRILAREHGVPWGNLLLVPITVACLNFTPIADSIEWGQLSTLLLLLFTLAWSSLRRGHEATGGVWLGVMLCLKPIFLPMILLLLLRRRWKAVFAATVFTLGANLIASAIIGWGAFLDYYLRVGSQVYPLYRAAHSNLSVGSLGWRIFAGTGGPDGMFWNAPPLLNAPVLAPVAATLASLTVLVSGLWLALKKEAFDSQFSITLLVSILISPVAWTHYLAWTLPPLFLLWTRLWQTGFKHRRTFLLIIVTLLLRTPLAIVEIPFGGIQLGQVDPLKTGFWPASMTLFPMLATTALIWLVWQSESIAEKCQR